MTTARTLRCSLAEHAVTLLALPSHYTPWLSPDTSKVLKLLVDFFVTFGLDVSRIAVRPLGVFGGLSRTLCASDVTALLANSDSGWIEQGLAFVAGAPYSLCRRLVCQLIASPGGDSQDLFLLGLLNSLCVDALVGWCLLLGVPGAFLAALVLALQTHLVVSIEGSAAVAASVDAHANSLLHAGD